MRAAILVLGAAICGGCVGVDAWPHGAKARPVLVGVDEWKLAGWSLTVEQAVGTWEWRMNGNDLRNVECAFPIEISDEPDACPIRLVADELWVHDGDLDGAEDDCWIDIKASKASVALVTHELGHAIGLDHSDDAESIMRQHVRVTNPSDADVRAAREILGCTPL